MIERLGELWEDLRWWSRRLLRRLGGGPTDDRQRVYRRRRLVALAAIVLFLLAIYRFVPLPGLSCEASPAKTCAPADDVISLVPAGAGLYAHLNLDRDSSQFSTAAEVLGRLPHARQIVQGSFDELALEPRLDPAADLATWVGDEAAFTRLSGGRRLTLLAVANEAGAKQFESRLGRGEPRNVGGGGLAYRAYRNDLAFADLDGFLAFGSEPAVRAAIETERGRRDSLADAEPVSELLDALPEQRLADVYLSRERVQGSLASAEGIGSQLDTFVDFGATRGVAAALVADGDGFEVELESALRAPERGETRSFFQAFPSFDPSLAGEFSPATLLYLNVADPAETVRALLRQASRSAPSLVAAYEAFVAEVREGGVDIERGVLPVLSGESAVGVATGESAPYVTAVFKGVDEDRARDQMARLQTPLIDALAPAATGQAPTFDATKVGDVVVRGVRISPALDIAYAIFDGKLVVSTNPAGVRQAIGGKGSLGANDAFEAATGGASSGVSALVFLNLEGLVSRSEPLGLDQIVRGFAEDVAKLRGLGLTVRSDDDSLETTLFLDIE